MANVKQTFPAGGGGDSGFSMGPPVLPLYARRNILLIIPVFSIPKSGYLYPCTLHSTNVFQLYFNNNSDSNCEMRIAASTFILSYYPPLLLLLTHSQGWQQGVLVGWVLSIPPPYQCEGGGVGLGPRLERKIARLSYVHETSLAYLSPYPPVIIILFSYPQNCGCEGRVNLNYTLNTYQSSLLISLTREHFGSIILHTVS
jgi:hypothetical protein